jgi:hypothetical protein
MPINLEDKYLEFAEMLSELSTTELKIRNMKRVVEELKDELSQDKNDGSYGLELSGHAFKQLSERLEILALENVAIYRDVFKDSTTSSLMLPSNLKSFIITLIANARKKGDFTKDKSKNSSDGVEYRYTIDIKSWSNEKTLQLVCIVENNYIKTGFFNFV